MVAVDENFQRRVRIIGKPGETLGYMMDIRDTDTGEAIENIFRAVVTLDANEQNTAELSYYASNEDTGGILADSGWKIPVAKTVTVDRPEIDVTAYEVVDKRFTLLKGPCVLLLKMSPMS